MGIAQRTVGHRGTFCNRHRRNKWCLQVSSRRNLLADWVEPLALVYCLQMRVVIGLAAALEVEALVGAEAGVQVEALVGVEVETLVESRVGTGVEAVGVRNRIVVETGTGFERQAVAVAVAVIGVAVQARRLVHFARLVVQSHRVQRSFGVGNIGLSNPAPAAFGNLPLQGRYYRSIRRPSCRHDESSRPSNTDHQAGRSVEYHRLMLCRYPTLWRLERKQELNYCQLDGQIEDALETWCRQSRCPLLVVRSQGGWHSFGVRSIGLSNPAVSGTLNPQGMYCRSRHHPSCTRDVSSHLDNTERRVERFVGCPRPKLCMYPIQEKQRQRMVQCQ